MVSKAIIEQQRREFGYPTPPVMPTTGPVLTLDLSTGLTQQFLLNTNCFVAEPVNPPSVGDHVVLVLQQDGSAGNFSVTWGVCFRDAPSWSPGAKGTRATGVFVWEGNTYQYIGGSSAFAVSGLAIVPNTGSALLTGGAMNVLTNPAPTVAAVTLGGVAPTITVNTIVSITPTIGAVTLAGVAPLVSVILTPSVATLTVQGQVPTRSP